MSDASDYRLAHMWRKYMRTLSLPDRKKLTGLIFCGSTVRRDTISPGVFILQNDKIEMDEAESRIYGVTFCHSTWSCPHCTPIVMSQKAARIAVAIEALEKKHDQIAVMVTFTLPHTRRIPCKDTFQILKNAWRLLSKKATCIKTKRYTTKKTNEKKVYKILSPFAKIMTDLEIKHHVKVYEFTWGYNGWHPHIHALWWIPRKKFNRITDYETQIREIWWDSVKKATRTYLKKNPLDESTMNYYEKIFAMDINEMIAKTHSETFSISKNSDGTPRHQKSSYYSCGWSGDSELNQELKKASKGHYTPHQMLERAYNEKNEETRLKFLQRYTEYAMATRGSRRVTFSPTGLNQIIEAWKKTNEYIELVKKKCIDHAVAQDNWKIVCWFTFDDWYTICCFEQESKTSIIAKILELAKLPKPRRRINSFLEKYGIRAQKPNKHASHIESTFNNVYTAA